MSVKSVRFIYQESLLARKEDPEAKEKGILFCQQVLILAAPSVSTLAIRANPHPLIPFLSSG
jgi:hypothetical protein